MTHLTTTAVLAVAGAMALAAQLIPAEAVVLAETTTPQQVLVAPVL
jgi:hypothetical protein